MQAQLPGIVNRSASLILCHFRLFIYGSKLATNEHRIRIGY